MGIPEPREDRVAPTTMTPIECQPCEPSRIPLSLLLEADPDELAIGRYRDRCRGFVARRAGEILSACLLLPGDDGRWELVNIATLPEAQGQGAGSKLLLYVIEQARDAGARELFLGTGTFGYQLAFYQRAGFRVVAVERDHFLTHYSQPIHEAGIQLKDRLILSLSFQ